MMNIDKPTFQSTGVATFFTAVNCKESITLSISLQKQIQPINSVVDKITLEVKICAYSKLRPVVAGYKIERASFLSGLITNTARQVKGNPLESFSAGSSIPNLTANSLFSSAIIG